nr:MAG TPA: hypothetical protein [Caudoviricetes sp.]
MYRLSPSTPWALSRTAAFSCICGHLHVSIFVL